MKQQGQIQIGTGSGGVIIVVGDDRNVASLVLSPDVARGIAKNIQEAADIMDASGQTSAEVAEVSRLYTPEETRAAIAANPRWEPPT